MIIAHNGTCTMFCNLLTDIRIAKETGYDGIEIIGSKLHRYLDQGFAIESLLPRLEDLPGVALGYVQDIERMQPESYAALQEETEEMCSWAEKLHIQMVQVLTGPIEPGLGMEVPDAYEKIMTMPQPELMKSTAKNLVVLADIAARHNLKLYMEPLTWTRLHTLKQGLELIDRAGRDNVCILIDFWHQWTSGTTPDDIAKLDKKVIGGVHFCDSLSLTGGTVTHDLREVWTGGGHIPLKEWVDAVLATGFDGWWSCELFSSKHWELDPRDTARLLKDTLEWVLV